MLLSGNIFGNNCPISEQELSEECLSNRWRAHKISALVIFSRMKKVEDEEEWTLFLTSCFVVELLSFNGGETELVSSCSNAGDTEVDSSFEVLTNTLVISICLSFT